ncbi:hypothetical protein ACVWZR_002347 [Bradyrhizobium sp. i1.3.1]
MGGRVDLLDRAALAGSRKLLGNRSEQAPAVGLDRQSIVATALAHRSRKRAGTMQRIGGNDAVFQLHLHDEFVAVCDVRARLDTARRRWFELRLQIFLVGGFERDPRRRFGD